MNPCRFQPSVDCKGHGSLSLNVCGGCPGPVDMTDRGWSEKRESKPGRKTEQPVGSGPGGDANKNSELGQKPAISGPPLKPAAPAPGQFATEAEAREFHKLTAPPTVREEEKTMPKNEKCPTGTCPDCGRENETLRTTKHMPGRYCSRCCGKFSARAMALAKKDGKATTKPRKPASAPKAPAAPKEPPAKPIAPQRATGAAPAAFEPLTARRLAEAIDTGGLVVLRVECWTENSLLAVIRAVAHDTDIMIGVASSGA